MLDPAIGLLLTGAFALLFASAASHKVRDLPVFAEVFRAYRLLPERLNLAWLVPLTEAAVVVGLLVPATRMLAAGLGAALLLVYALAMGINLARGRRELSCGCGGPSERRPIAAWMVVRNVLLAAALLLSSLPWGLRPLQAVDFLTAGAGVAVVALIYMSLDRLLGRIAPRTAQWQG